MDELNCEFLNYSKKNTLSNTRQPFNNILQTNQFLNSNVSKDINIQVVRHEISRQYSNQIKTKAHCLEKKLRYDFSHLNLEDSLEKIADCTGAVRVILRICGYELPKLYVRDLHANYTYLKSNNYKIITINKNRFRPGDIIFLRNKNKQGVARPTHIAIAISETAFFHSIPESNQFGTDGGVIDDLSQLLKVYDVVNFNTTKNKNSVSQVHDDGIQLACNFH
jgi:NlpC/P60 family